MVARTFVKVDLGQLINRRGPSAIVNKMVNFCIKKYQNVMIFDLKNS
jgi:hypothetical protein